ncbi:MAG TPA: substrate-binding domain-containing protein [Flavobacterium sp.]|jgi:phosphate transport system substrate-binding protein
MNKHFIILMFSVLTLAFAVLCCNRNKEDNSAGQTILAGKATIIADETLVPIIEDQIAVFESEYNADITLTAKPEAEVVNALLNDAEQVAILSRNLTDEEKQRFSHKNIIPRITKFAVDAVAFIRNQNSNDTLIALADVISFMKGNEVENIKGLVFDNPNSSTARYLAGLAGLQQVPEKNIYSFGTNTAAIKYLSENQGMVGVVGLNWLLQPPSDIEEELQNIAVLSVKGTNSEEYVFPTQNSLAEGTYPLARDLFVVNCQGFSGLGMGFASFVAGERGQRIILKSGLLPVRIPGRKIIIRNQINKK